MDVFDETIVLSPSSRQKNRQARLYIYIYCSSNCSLNNVAFGASDCKVLGCSSKWIKCKTTNANNFYYIDNNGYDPCK